MCETHQKRLRKQLLRAAAKYIYDRGPGVQVGMCAALCNIPNAMMRPERLNCMRFVSKLYYTDSNNQHQMFWMGNEFTEEQQQHRVMALLFAAEAYDDMEGL